MKRLFRYLSPFAPDQSGAAAVFFEYGGVIVICDAGGCTGNICGFDEPRWFSMRSRVFSAGLRDIDAILGQDDKLVRKIADAVTGQDAHFVCLIGTPVPSIIATDFRAICRMIEKQTGVPAVWVDTNGMETYEQGQKKAYLALIHLAERLRDPAGSSAGEAAVGSGKEAAGAEEETVGAEEESAGSGKEAAPFTGVWGATPLDLPAGDSADRLRARFQREGKRAEIFGMGSAWERLPDLFNAEENLVVSPSGLAPAEYLNEHFGIPYRTGFLLSDEDWGEAPEAADGGFPEDAGILIVHQKLFADEVRKMMERVLPEFSGRITEASFFECGEGRNAGTGDGRDGGSGKAQDGGGCLFLEGESDLIRLVRDENFRVIAADPVMRRALPEYSGTFLELPHYAVSGQVFSPDSEDAFLRKIKKGFLLSLREETSSREA
ncbi:MAG: nitrogenase component 1 [Anaerovoracaceae bacterium]|jgi:hypothetical protein